MMDAMQLNDIPENYYNPDEQYGIKVIEDYDFREPYDWSLIRPSKVQLSQTYISALFRILNQLTGLPFSTVWVTVLYWGLLVLSFYVILKAAFRHLGKGAIGVFVGFVLLFCGSANLGWLNSLYGEGIGFISLLMVVASSISLLERERGKGGVSWLWYLLSAALLTGAKAQYALLLPVLLLWGAVLFWYHLPEGRKRKWGMAVVFLCLAGLLIREAGSVYQNNESISSQDTLYQGLCYGILMVADDPEQALLDLGLDTRLAADAGKNAYLSDEEYFCVPRSEMAEELIYSKVSSVDYLVWYLKHPKALLTMMNAAAKASNDPMPDYFLYVGEKTSEEHRTVSKLDFWREIRSKVTPSWFVEYVVFYGVLFLFCLKGILTKKKDKKIKMYLGLFLVFMLCGILQYPLTVIGNGFADNIKQLYLFRVTYDGTLLTAVFLIGGWILKKYRQTRENPVPFRWDRKKKEVKWDRKEKETERQDAI
jgi:hypothetical protein